MPPSIKQQISKYSNKSRTEKDVATVVGVYPSLKAGLDKYFYENGQSKDLLCLNGTVPITYQGNNYNIPVQIWVPENYPGTAPFVYVKPTSSMAVRANQFVNNNGRVTTPYVMQWNSASSNLSYLANDLIKHFNQMPPVYSKAPTQTQPSYAQHPQYPHGYPQPAATGYPPMYGQQHSGGYPGQYGYPSQSMNPPYPTGQTTGPPSSGPGYPPYPNGMPGITPPPYYPPTSTNQNVSSNNAAFAQPNNQQGQQHEEAIKASLLTAIQEQLSRRLDSAQEYAQKDLDKLNGVQEKLQMNRVALEETVSQLNQHITAANLHLATLDQKKAEVENALVELQSKSEKTEVDEVVNPSCPLFKQLLNLYAEECALEDTVYHLDKALMTEVIDLETYLKQVRGLSRKQFMVRALMQKARKTAGLRNITPH